MRILVITLALLIAPINLAAQNAYQDAVKANKEYKRVTNQFTQKYDEIMEEGDVGVLTAVYYYYLDPKGLQEWLAGIKKQVAELSKIEKNWQRAREDQLLAEEKLKKYPKTYSRYLTERWVPEKKVPRQENRSIYIDRVVYQGRTINNGARNDLAVYFKGRPLWPITAELTATACPPGVNCPPVAMQFNSSAAEGYNVVIMPRVLYCTGFRRSASIGAQVVLRDGAGNVTAPKPITTHCIVQ